MTAFEARKRVPAGTVSGLRTRFFPKSRIGQGLLSVAPWVDIALLAVAFALLEGRLVLQPGVIVDVPRAPFSNGSRAVMTAVIISVEGTGETAEREEIVFFDDEPFPVRQSSEMTRLGKRLARRAQAHGGEGLVIQADRRVRHGTVMEVVNMAAEAGIEEVNVATRPE